LKEQIKLLPNNRKSKDKIISELKNSLIINNNIKYIESIQYWINPVKEIKGELLYRLSKDGDQISTFHNLCDNKGPTLTLFEIEGGVIGGIYTPLSWDSSSGWKEDMETFIFNLSIGQKYKKLKNENSIYCSNNHGPWIYFFGFDQMRKIQHQGLRINEYYDKGSEILPNNNENIKDFDVKEVEVYKIVIE